MRNESRTKRRRNLALVEYQKQHPELSLKEIGEVFGGISKQRVFAIIKKETTNAIIY